MNFNIEPPKESLNPPPPPLPAPAPSSFSSLPEEIVLSILAHISASYYPKLSLVSKIFRSLILSKDLENVRKRIKTLEECVYICGNHALIRVILPDGSVSGSNLMIIKP
ncbi:unnamed protein product [Microthlaspi erraticum]|uniref:F-box domain-containing protein n=1 Tax=Microthlaspi erraticum TaxID=1685480 RepID=A0A6D2KNN5_9BRAS|nr:unnamed protein product [Microthlaspi erraticum]